MCIRDRLCNLADEIAYNAHDIDDGVRSGLLTLEQLTEVPLFERHRRQAAQAHPGLSGRRLLYESIRLMLSAQVHDAIDATALALRRTGVASADEVRRAPTLVCFAGEMREESGALKQFLLANLYRHPQVRETTGLARQVVRELFEAYASDPKEMPSAHAGRRDGWRAIADYIAGMTDRFAAREHERLTGRRLLPA